MITKTQPSQLHDRHIVEQLVNYYTIRHVINKKAQPMLAYPRDAKTMKTRSQAVARIADRTAKNCKVQVT